MKVLITMFKLMREASSKDYSKEDMFMVLNVD